MWPRNDGVSRRSVNFPNLRDTERRQARWTCCVDAWRVWGFVCVRCRKKCSCSVWFSACGGKLNHFSMPLLSSPSHLQITAPMQTGPHARLGGKMNRSSENELIWKWFCAAVISVEGKGKSLWIIFTSHKHTFVSILLLSGSSHVYDHNTAL